MAMDDVSKLIQTDHLIQAIINLEGTPDVRLLDDLVVKRATTGVEGFLSLVLRVRVSYRVGEDPEPRRTSLIVKCLPKDEVQLKIVKATNVFEREGIFYDKAWPLMKKVAAGKLDVSIPRCYYACYDGVHDTIYMEDLGEYGFTTVGRRQVVDGLDWNHASLLAKKLGLLHALGLAAEKLLPDGKNWSEAYPVFGEEPLFYEPKPGHPPVPFKGIVDTGNDIVIEVASGMTGLAKEAAESGKLRRIVDQFWPIVCELASPNQKGHNILSHGDCWVNNVMFRYEVDNQVSNIPVELKFIDFQNAKYCHPSIDLLCFIHLSTRKSFRDVYYDKIIAEYYSSLEGSLKVLEFGPPPFSLEEFIRDLKDVYKSFTLYLCAVYTPCMLLEEEFTPEKAEDMTSEKYEEFLNSGNVSAIRKRLSSDPTYLSNVQDVIQEFVDVVFPDGSLESTPFLK